MTPRRFIAPSAVLWLLVGAAYFLIPLVATFLFSLKNDQTAKCCTLANYGGVFDDPEFWKTIRLSFVIALETIVVTLALLVPTVYWVHLKLPRLRPLIGFLALVPFVVAPIILVVGLLDLYKGSPSWFYAEPYGFLPAAYVILPSLHVLLARHRIPLDRHPYPHGGVAEPRRRVAHDAVPGDRPEHQGSGARGLVPHAGDRDGRVHDREPGAVQDLPRAHPVRQSEQGLSGGSADTRRVRDHVGGDARAARRRTWTTAVGRPGGEIAMAGVELRQLHRRFGDVVALDGIDLEIGSAEFVSFLGPSGCGKTTALRLVAGFDRPTSGRILVDGKDITGVPPNRRDIGMVFQAYSLFPNMTAVRNVEFGLRVRKHGRGDRRQRALELLELVGLGHAADRYPYQLSGGMQQRVALARALAIEPRVLLLDEPLSALDAKVRVQLREEIRRIQTRLEITTIYVTHDQEEALSISDRVAVISHGRIEQVGKPAEIYGAPATPFVAEFVGTMNRIESTVADTEAGRVDYDGARWPLTRPGAGSAASGCSCSCGPRPSRSRRLGRPTTGSPARWSRRRSSAR